MGILEFLVNNSGYYMYEGISFTQDS